MSSEGGVLASPRPHRAGYFKVEFCLRRGCRMEPRCIMHPHRLPFPSCPVPETPSALWHNPPTHFPSPLWCPWAVPSAWHVPDPSPLLSDYLLFTSYLRILQDAPDRGPHIQPLPHPALLAPSSYVSQLPSPSVSIVTGYTPLSGSS